MMRWRRRDRTDFDDEIRSHIELEAERLRAEGVPAEESFDRARRRFGNVTRVQERYHDSRRIRWLDALAHDLRFGWRQLRRSPGFTAVVVVTLTLGIGANAVIFGVVDRLLLRPPPGLAQPERLARVYFQERRADGDVGAQPVTTYPFITALRDGAPSLDVAGFAFPSKYTLGRGADAGEVDVQLVTGNFFGLLGVRPALGRFFAPDEDRIPRGAPVAVVSHGFWRRHLGGEPDAVGRTLQVGQFALTVVGVTPPEFVGVESRRVDVWVPASAVASTDMGDDWATNAGNWWIRALVRLRPGASAEQASAEATTVFRRALREWRQPWRDSLGTVALGSIIEARGPQGRPAEARVSLWLAGVSGIVLLVACANVANLLLARAVTRRREIAVRLAIGIGRARLIRQLLTETLLFALLAAAAALLLAQWGGRVLRALLLPDVPAGAGAFDTRVLAFTGVATLLTMLLAGLAPAIVASRANLAGALKGGGREGGARRTRLRTALLVTQAALSVALLVGAGLFVRSLQRVRGLDVGVDLPRVLMVRMDLVSGGFSRDERSALYEAAAERARQLPGVTHASLVSGTVPTRNAVAVGAETPGRDSLPELPNGGPYRSTIDAAYFGALGARIVRGRGIDDADVRHGARVVVVNELIARHWWPDADPIGQCLRLSRDAACSEVVGVVQDVVLFGLIGDERAQLYVPHGHPAVTDSARGSAPPSAMLVRTSEDPAAVAAALRRRLQELRPGMGYVDARTFEELLAPQLRPWRLGAAMFSVFGTVALLIAAVGLYGALAYAVSQRTSELGVRMALGARRADVVALFVRGGVQVTLVGLAFGAALAWLAAPRLSELLHETSPRDPVVFATVAVVLLGVALAASLVPAWRASRLDPTVALRSE